MDPFFQTRALLEQRRQEEQNNPVHPDVANHLQGMNHGGDMSDESSDNGTLFQPVLAHFVQASQGTNASSEGARSGMTSNNNCHRNSRTGDEEETVDHQPPVPEDLTPEGSRPCDALQESCALLSPLVGKILTMVNKFHFFGTTMTKFLMPITTGLGQCIRKLSQAVHNKFFFRF
jgi:hypothetical protein